jgi:ABC-type transport system involved in cytochrome c biogenesis permease subunit
VKLFFSFLLLVSMQAFAQTNILGEQFESISPESGLEKFIAFSKQIPTDIIAQVPAHQGGRLKPLDTLTRETLLFLIGKYSRWGLDSNQIYLGLMLSNNGPWLEIIDARDPEARAQLGFLKTKKYVSLAELESSNLNQLVGPIFEKQKENAKNLTATEKSLLELANQVSLFGAILTGDHLIGSLDFSHLNDGNSGSTMAKTKENIVQYFQKLKTDPQNSMAEAKVLVDWGHGQKVPELFEHALGKVDIEIFYNRAQVFFWASILYLLLGILLITPSLRRHLSKPAVIGIFLLPLVLQIVGLTLRVYITRFAPITNMYGTMIWVSMGVNLFSLVLYMLYGNAILSGTMLIISGFILFLTHSFPMILSPDLDPIVAVLRNNFWLSTHVTTITISYAAFTIAMVLGNIALIKNILGKNLKTSENEMAHHAYRMVQLGCFLLTVGIILGGIWADYSWGRFWGWDPKETWALIADLAFLAILHSRYIGWAPPFLFLALCPIAYLTVIMAWYGVNFILAAGLHSYGFSSGGAAAVGIFVSAQLILLVVSVVIYKIKHPKLKQQ